MPSTTVSDRMLVATASIFVIGVLLLGYIAQQILLSVYIAGVGLLLAVLVYFGQRFIGGSNGENGANTTY